MTEMYIKTKKSNWLKYIRHIIAYVELGQKTNIQSKDFGYITGQSCRATKSTRRCKKRNHI